MLYGCVLAATSLCIETPITVRRVLITVRRVLNLFRWRQWLDLIALENHRPVFAVNGKPIGHREQGSVIVVHLRIKLKSFRQVAFHCQVRFVFWPSRHQISVIQMA